MNYEEYYTRVMGAVPETVVSDDFFSRNKQFIEAIIFEYHRVDEQYDDFDPEAVSDNIIIFFSNLKHFGLR